MKVRYKIISLIIGSIYGSIISSELTSKWREVMLCMLIGAAVVFLWTLVDLENYYENFKREHEKTTKEVL